MHLHAVFVVWLVFTICLYPFIYASIYVVTYKLIVGKSLDTCKSIVNRKIAQDYGEDGCPFPAKATSTDSMRLTPFSVPSHKTPSRSCNISMTSHPASPS